MFATSQRFHSSMLVVVLLMLPVVGYWAARVRFGTPIVRSWLPSTHEAIADYDQFLEWFGEDQFLLVSWEGCTVDDSRLRSASDRLKKLAVEVPELGILGVTDSCASVDRMMAAHRVMSREAASRRLKYITVGRDGESFLAVQLDASPGQSYRETIEAVTQSVEESTGVPAEQLILAGEPLQVDLIDRSSRETIGKYVLPSSVGALLVAWLCLRSLHLTVIVFCFAGIAQLLGLGLVSFFLGEMSAVIVVLPTLVFMLTLSAAIHLANYYADAERRGVASANLAALRVGAGPCLLATLTTAFGFGSLAVSSIAPVWQFGGLASLGLCVSTAVLLLCFPALVQVVVRIPLPLFKRSSAHLESTAIDPGLDESDQASAAATAEHETELSSQWARPLAWFCKVGSLPISLAGIALLIVSAAGLPRLTTSTEFTDMFSSESRAVQDLRWVEDHLGPVSTLEIVLRVSDGTTRDLLDQATQLRKLHIAIARLDGIRSVSSAALFLPAIPQATGIRSTLQRSVMRSKIGAGLPAVKDSRLLVDDNGDHLWRLTAKIDGLRNTNYAEKLAELNRACEQALQSDDEQPQNTFTISGMRAVVETAHTALLTDLAASFVTAFILITPVMMLITRSLVAGLILMIPNTLPVVIVFGTMGWFSVQLDVASILTASVALGIAVDDTLHFVAWYLRRIKDGASRESAVLSAIEACGRPMLHTSVICTGAMLPFFFCDFLPTSKFALLMILILSGAIIGDLILLPAILLSPLARLAGVRLTGDRASSKQSARSAPTD